MKKTFFVLAVIFLFSSISFSQPFAHKGSIELGGSIGFSSYTGVINGETADESITSFYLMPYFGYFVVDNFELGIIPEFSTSSQGDNSSSAFAILFAPAYNFNTNGTTFPFIEGQIGYNTSSIDISESDDITMSGLVWGVRGGVKVLLGKNALLNLAVGYQQVTRNPENWEGDRNGSNTIRVSGGFTVALGN